MAFAERLGNFIWNPWLLGLFLLSGLYFSVRTGFFQLFHVRLWLKTTLGSLLRPKRRREGGGLTQLQALSTALASTIRERLAHKVSVASPLLAIVPRRALWPYLGNPLT